MSSVVVRVLGPFGLDVSIRVSRAICVHDLVSQLVDGREFAASSHGVHLKPWISLDAQQITDNDVIHVHLVKGRCTHPDDRPRAGIARQIYSIMMEAQRIEDRNMVVYESAGGLVTDYSSDDDDCDDAVMEPTIVTSRPEAVSVDPLPDLCQEEMKEKKDGPPRGEYEVQMRPLFTAVEGAAEFFIDDLQGRWNW